MQCLIHKLLTHKKNRILVDLINQRLRRLAESNRTHPCIRMDTPQVSEVAFDYFYLIHTSSYYFDLANYAFEVTYPFKKEAFGIASFSHAV